MKHLRKFNEELKNFKSNDKDIRYYFMDYIGQKKTEQHLCD